MVPATRRPRHGTEAAGVGRMPVPQPSPVRPCAKSRLRLLEIIRRQQSGKASPIRADDDPPPGKGEPCKPRFTHDLLLYAPTTRCRLVMRVRVIQLDIGPEKITRKKVRSGDGEIRRCGVEQWIRR